MTTPESLFVAAALLATAIAAGAQPASSGTVSRHPVGGQLDHADGPTMQRVKPGASGGIVIGPPASSFSSSSPQAAPLGGVAGSGAGSGAGSAVAPGIGAAEEP